ncbi:uncharacterized protein UHOD_07091 [Ustilago sp. UG-2017b]|nr:uncharacterized protein UHOD_07091 [Ustilago sp. UG-2017b]
MSSSFSSRVSALSSSSTSTAKSFNPPRPTYNSPKLVRDSSLVAHPFASSSYTASSHASVESDPSYHQASQRSRSASTSSHPFCNAHTSQFGAIFDNLDVTCQSPYQVAADSLVSPATDDCSFQDAMVRSRSSTLGSRNVLPSQSAAFPPPIASPNPFKSQFDDDSEDEEKIDVAAKALAGVPHRARLAAIGTASRLFKGRRHSRNSFASLTADSTNNQGLLAPLQQLDKASSRQRDKQVHRPSTSDGTSPHPRQAVFGHRPSPSELSFGSHQMLNNKPRGPIPADKDLILGLKGAAVKPRFKLAEKNKSLPKTPEEHAISHHRQASSSVALQSANGTVSWMDPPPYYCLSEQVELKNGRDSLRKSQSLSTLRFDASRRPKLPSPPSQVQAAVSVKSAAYTQRCPWEAMLNTPPSTVDDHSSLESCGRIARVETSFPDSSPRGSLHKPQRLPPQKPPPQTLPPPPPPLASKQHIFADSSAKSSVEVGRPSLTSSAGSSASSEKQGVSPKQSIESVRSQNKQASLDKAEQLIPQRMQCTSSGAQIELNVGGTKFVTLFTTLLGAPGDDPRCIDHLSPHREMADKNTSEAALCAGAHLTRRKRVDRGTRHQCIGSQESSLDSPTSVSVITVDQEASPTHPSNLTSSIGSLALPDPLSTNSSSSSFVTSSSSSQIDSGTSTRRTSDLSDASSWSKANAPTTTTHEESSGVITPSRIFLDRNAELYSDILDILRTRKLPYRLQVASIAHTTESSSACRNEQGCALTALKLQLTCRLLQVKQEAEWLGYRSVVELCAKQIHLL